MYCVKEGKCITLRRERMHCVEGKNALCCRGKECIVLQGKECTC